MAIVKMKKLHVIAMADRREELLKGLLHLGCVEISEPGEVLADPQWASLFQRSGSSLAERKGQLTDVNTALDAIKQYAKLKDGMFIKRHPITEAEFLDAGAAEKAQAACDAVREQLGILTKAQSEAGRLESRAAALKPWESLDLPLERSGTAHTIFRLGVCPGQTDVGAIRVQMEAEGLAAEVIRDSHADMERYAVAETVDCVVFNFGRLPGGDPSIFTRSDTSVAALEAALRLLKPGGVVAIALYYGGANGYGERDAVMTWLETLDDRKFSVLRCDWANRRNDPPVPIFIWKE